MPRKLTANNIKKLRMFKGMNQTDFAGLFDINRSNIGSYEEARAEPKLEVLIKIAEHFNLTVDQLVRKELTVNDIAGFQLDYSQPLTGQNSLTLDERLERIMEKLNAIEKRLNGQKKDRG